MRPPRCASCRTTLALGLDVIAIQHGVVGPRGFVPLDEPDLVCSEECLAQYPAPIEEAPHRIP